MSQQIIEELMLWFGRTGKQNRPRIRKWHAEILYSKFVSKENLLCKEEISRPEDYIKRMVKLSKGFIEFINEEKFEMRLTDLFFETMASWARQYADLDELDHSDENLEQQGIIVKDDNITFDGRLTYSRFYKIISDEGESMNDPAQWVFNDKKIEDCQNINFSKKSSAFFASRLFLLKFYVLRKIDEVAFVTSRFVHCPKCAANYVVPASKIEFQKNYKCENRIGDKFCGTSLKKFPARKMLPTYIYEIAVEVRTKEGIAFKEFFLESFTDLHPGYYTGMVFGRTENKSNTFYFLCLTVREEKSKFPFRFQEKEQHEFFNLMDSVYKHIKKVGFIIDTEKARLVLAVECLKKLVVTINKEINVDHSLYFGAPGIGKTYALNLIHHLFYSNSGFISGPRFTLPGLTGGQKEVVYQDTSRKKNVTGLFSMQAFIFDEINNAQFLGDNKATNLFKSCVLSSAGTSSTIGGKEFPRTALIAGTANYEIDKLKHYENKVRKMFLQEKKGTTKVVSEQEEFLSKILDEVIDDNDIPKDFDFYLPMQNYKADVKKELRSAILRVRDGEYHHMTGFAKPLMERFCWTVLVHPRYDQNYMKTKEVDVLAHLQNRSSIYTQRELLSQLYVADFDQIIKKKIKDTFDAFNDPKIERDWTNQARRFLNLLTKKYVHFFSMFKRIEQVYVYALFSLSLINREVKLSHETKRIFEKLVSCMHTPIKMKDFHDPNFEDFKYICETRIEFLRWLKKNPEHDVREVLDLTRTQARLLLVDLQNFHRIEKISDFKYKLIRE